MSASRIEVTRAGALPRESADELRVARHSGRKLDITKLFRTLLTLMLLRLSIPPGAIRLRVSPRIMSSQASPVGGLLRVLGLGFGVCVTLGNTIGAGIMGTPGQIAARLPVPALIIAAWIAGGLYALLGSFAMAELGAMIPRSGGYYALTRRAYGEYLSFAVGWTDWLGLCASGALVAILAGQYAQHLLPRLARLEVVVAIVAVMILTLVQWRGVRWGGWAQNITSGITAVAFFSLIVAGLMLTSRTGSTTVPSALPSGLH